MREVLTKADLEGRKAPPKEKGRVMQPILVFKFILKLAFSILYYSILNNLTPEQLKKNPEVISLKWVEKGSLWHLYGWKKWRQQWKLRHDSILFLCWKTSSSQFFRKYVWILNEIGKAFLLFVFFWKNQVNFIQSSWWNE